MLKIILYHYIDIQTFGGSFWSTWNGQSESSPRSGHYSCSTSIRWTIVNIDVNIDLNIDVNIGVNIDVTVYINSNIIDIVIIYIVFNSSIIHTISISLYFPLLSDSSFNFQFIFILLIHPFIAFLIVQHYWLLLIAFQWIVLLM